MGRNTSRNLRNRRRNQQNRKKLARIARQAKKMIDAVGRTKRADPHAEHDARVLLGRGIEVASLGLGSLFGGGGERIHHFRRGGRRRRNRLAGLLSQLLEAFLILGPLLGEHRLVRTVLPTGVAHHFARLRIGIGRPPPGFRGQVADFVLSHFDASERAELPDILNRAAESVLDVLARGLKAAMNKLNTKTPRSDVQG